MARNITNRNKGITRNPEAYDGYDTLHNVFRRTLDGKTIVPGIYNALTVFVRKSTDPSDKTFYVMAWVPDLDVVEKPLINPNPATLVLEEITSLNFYEQATAELPEPAPGQAIRILMSDPENRLGYYIGLSPKEIPFTTVTQRENAEGAKKAFTAGSNDRVKQAAEMQQSIERDPNEIFEDKEAEMSLDISKEDAESLQELRNQQLTEESVAASLEGQSVAE